MDDRNKNELNEEVFGVKEESEAQVEQSESTDDAVGSLVNTPALPDDDNVVVEKNVVTLSKVAIFFNIASLFLFIISLIIAFTISRLSSLGLAALAILFYASFFVVGLIMSIISLRKLPKGVFLRLSVKVSFFINLVTLIVLAIAFIYLLIHFRF